MKQSALTWFDRLMMNVTFAEAGVDFSFKSDSSQKKDNGRAEKLIREMNPGEETVAPAHS